MVDIKLEEALNLLKGSVCLDWFYYSVFVLFFLAVTHILEQEIKIFLKAHVLEKDAVNKIPAPTFITIH